MKNTQGPCLPHCYKDEKLIFLLIGFILGIGAYILADFIVKRTNQYKEKHAPIPSN
jgi:hypothetical protein